MQEGGSVVSSPTLYDLGCPIVFDGCQRRSDSRNLNAKCRVIRLRSYSEGFEVSKVLFSPNRLLVGHELRFSNIIDL
jgi:hypothetical protein